jgi:predicted lysophospholipase L1 biosynthesis ABC-type transport system permease subunit
MSSVRNWALGLVITALALLSPVIAFLLIITAEMLIDLLMEGGAIADFVVCAVVVAWVFFRGRSPDPEKAPRPGPERVSEKAVIAAPPI